MRRALLLVVAILVVAPASASAHATLEVSAPERGAKLDAVPAQVVLRFDEPVEASFGALRVFDQQGREAQAGKPFRPGGDSKQVAVKLRPGTKPGGFTATYRVVSADSHPVSGGFVFTVGDAAAPAKTVDELLQGSNSGPVTSTAFAVVRAIQYGAIAIDLGALIFLLFAWGKAAPGNAAAGGDASGQRSPRRPPVRHFPQACGGCCWWLQLQGC